MARIRTVKPELFKHEDLYEAEAEYQLPLRLAFIALFTCCDREGRFRWRPRRLKLDIFPYDNIDISRVLDALVTRGFIVKYEKNGEVYGCIPSWSRHQNVNHREIGSDIPSLEESTPANPEKSSKNNYVTTIESRVPDACPTREALVAEASRACPGGIWNMERNMEGNMECGIGKGSIDASVTLPSTDPQPIAQIFDHWKTVMNHPNAKLDDKRKAIIRKALKSGYNTEQLCQAITGCSYTPHNMGDNDRGQRYDGLHVILRDGDQIDRFMHNCHQPPRPLSDAERRTQANLRVMEDWLADKMTVEGEIDANS